MGADTSEARDVASALIPRAWVRSSPSTLCMRRPAPLLHGPTYKDEWDRLELRCSAPSEQRPISHCIFPLKQPDSRASKVTCFCPSVACQSRRNSRVSCSVLFRLTSGKKRLRFISIFVIYYTRSAEQKITCGAFRKLLRKISSPPSRRRPATVPSVFSRCCCVTSRFKMSH